MKFVETVKNIFKIEDLRKRILYTLGLILIYRFGCYVVIPGVDPQALVAAQESASAGGQGLLGLLDIFSGGAFSNASIFALGIMPYISASIVIQLLGIVIPYFQKLQKEGESGRRKINQWTRYLTILVLLIQAPAYLASESTMPTSAIIAPGFLFNLTAVLSLLAGTMFMMWLGEKITDKGIGNGVSLIIMIGIVARLPHAFIAELNTRLTGQGGGLIMFIAEIVILYLVYMASIALVQAVWWCTSVHSFENQCCGRNAYHLRTSVDVRTYDFRSLGVGSRFCSSIPIQHCLVQCCLLYFGSCVHLLLYRNYC